MRWLERQVPKILEAVEEFMLSMEELKYAPPKTVGTVRVKDIRESKAGNYENIVLDLPTQDEGDRSPYIRKVPKGWFNEEALCAEVIVREYKGPSLPNWKKSVFLDQGGYCVVAIRPFKPNTYGDPVDINDPKFKEMFDVNVKGPKYCQEFYERFMGGT